MSTAEPLLGSPNGAEDTELPDWGSTSRLDLRSGIKKGFLGEGEDKMPYRKRLSSRRFLLFGLGILSILGFVQLITLLSHLIVLFIPDGLHNILNQWGKPGHIGSSLASWPTDFSRDILPIPCHSHNDYWRNVPLYSAIAAGCIGVEADIWHFDDKLYVGHSIPSLTPNRTLDFLYINPLLDILSKQNPTPQVLPDPDKSLNGVFDTSPSQSLILLIDFKTAGEALWPHMYSALDPLRQNGYLTHVKNSEIISRPITVVGTGNTPFTMVISDEHNPHHDVFFDAPLDQMEQPITADDDTPTTTSTFSLLSRSPSSDSPAPRNHTYNSLNSYYASISLPSTLGHVPWNGKLTPSQLDLLRTQVGGAHARGLKARYWELPVWPIGLRNQVWDTLVKEGVDLLNVDDLKGATERDWAERKGWWWWWRSGKKELGKCNDGD